MTCSAHGSNKFGKPALAALAAFSPSWTGPTWQHEPAACRSRPGRRRSAGARPPAVAVHAATGITASPSATAGREVGHRGDRRMAASRRTRAGRRRSSSRRWPTRGFPPRSRMVDAPVPTVDLTIHFRVALPYRRARARGLRPRPLRQPHRGGRIRRRGRTAVGARRHAHRPQPPARDPATGLRPRPRTATGRGARILMTAPASAAAASTPIPHRRSVACAIHPTTGGPARKPT